MDKLCYNIGTKLPNGEQFKLWFCQSRPVVIKPLINCKHLSPISIKIRHLFQLLSHDNIIIFGIEIFVYLQIYPSYIDQYVFIPKCDTVGLVQSKVKLGLIIPLLLKFVLQYKLDDYNINLSKLTDNGDNVENSNVSLSTDTGYLLNKLQTYLQNNSIVNLKYYKDSSMTTGQNIFNKNPVVDSRAVEKPLSSLPVNKYISLFTKSAEQYLYPHSSKNKYKHLVNGHILLKWWLRIIQDCTNENWSKKLIIPGGDTKGYLLPGWITGEIFTRKDSSPLAVYSVPLFPDDPKGRFLEHLIVENRYNSFSIKQFYYELGYRQEFRLGDLVGLIGCKLQKKEDESKDEEDASQVKSRNSYDIQENNEVKEPPYTIVPVSLKNYKQILNLIKSTDFTATSDVQQLIEVSIPEINKRFDSHIFLQEIVGSNKIEVVKEKQTQVNVLPVKRVNNLTNLVKRKKKT